VIDDRSRRFIHLQKGHDAHGKGVLIVAMHLQTSLRLLPGGIGSRQIKNLSVHEYP
jgi:hypothetical protein